MVALTFSNLAWDRIRRGNKDEESEYEEYKKLLKEYVDLFQRELETLKVHDVEVRSIFDAPDDKSDKHTIIAIPAGYDLDDQVLADSRFRFGELLESKWSKVLVGEILKTSKPESGLALLQFWYGNKNVDKVIQDLREKPGIAGVSLVAVTALTIHVAVRLSLISAPLMK